MKPRDRADGQVCAGADRPAPAMTSSFISVNQPPTVVQQQTRRHIERPIRVWPFAMECLAETETETDSTEEQKDGRLGDSTVTKHQPLPFNKDNRVKKTGSNNNNQQQQQSDSNKKIVEAESVGGCTPFFGVKHYLHNFYGLPDDDTSAKIWRQIEAVSLVFKKKIFHFLIDTTCFFNTQRKTKRITSLF